MDPRQRRVDEFNAGAAGHHTEPDHSFPATTEKTRGNLFGAKDVGKLGRGPTALVPFPGARRKKGEQLYDREAVRQELSQAPRLVEIDPRILSGSQPGLQRAGVEHYMGDEYDETGRTFEGGHNVGNQFPFVVSKPTNSPHPEHPTHEHVIISGHHRATAALLQGRRLRTRWVEQEGR